MTRMSKQGERRALSPKRRKAPSKKSGPKKDQLPQGYKEQQNALAGIAQVGFIPKIKSC